tara:strand:+ start:955 stop:1359 length:405 start_codon:yes stop_codon:yes gene_type:complete
MLLRLILILLSIGIFNVNAYAAGCKTCRVGEPCVNPCPPPPKPQFNPCPTCCQGKGGIHYCDSSAGRFVCQNGEFSACYCDRHAVMDLQKIEGCCLWQGGVAAIDETGLVVCNDGGVSETCTNLQVLQAHHHHW